MLKVTQPRGEGWRRPTGIPGAWPLFPPCPGSLGQKPSLSQRIREAGREAGQTEDYRHVLPLQVT